MTAHLYLRELWFIIFQQWKERKEKTLVELNSAIVKFSDVGWDLRVSRGLYLFLPSLSNLPYSGAQLWLTVHFLHRNYKFLTNGFECYENAKGIILFCKEERCDSFAEALPWFLWKVNMWPVTGTEMTNTLSSIPGSDLLLEDVASLGWNPKDLHIWSASEKVKKRHRRKQT